MPSFEFGDQSQLHIEFEKHYSGLGMLKVEEDKANWKKYWQYGDIFHHLMPFLNFKTKISPYPQKKRKEKKNPGCKGSS